MKKILPLNSNGVTLTEILVASAVGLVVAGGIFSFITLSGRLTDETKVQQQMEIESSTINDLFARTVRGAKAIMAEADASVPTVDLVTTSLKAIGTAGDTTILRIASSKYLIRSRAGIPETLVTDLDSLKDLSFLIYKDGFMADLRIALRSKGSDAVYQRKTDVVQARCRNYLPPQLVSPPFLDPISTFSNPDMGNPGAVGFGPGIINAPPDNNTGGVAVVNPPNAANPPPAPPAPPSWWAY